MNRRRLVTPRIMRFGHQMKPQGGNSFIWWANLYPGRTCQRSEICPFFKFRSRLTGIWAVVLYLYFELIKIKIGPDNQEHASRRLNLWSLLFCGSTVESGVLDSFLLGLNQKKGKTRALCTNDMEIGTPGRVLLFPIENKIIFNGNSVFVEGYPSGSLSLLLLVSGPTVKPHKDMKNLSTSGHRNPSTFPFSYLGRILMPTGGSSPSWLFHRNTWSIFFSSFLSRKKRKKKGIKLESWRLSS